MKYFTNLLVLLFTVLVCHTTQANVDSNPNYIYTIHIGAFDKAKLSDFDEIRDIGFVYAYPLRDDLMQIFLGGYSSRNTARQILPEVQKSGYPDAYVMRRALDEGDDVVTVQLAKLKPGQDLDYGKYLQAGTIYVSQVDNELVVLSGQYMNESVAQQRAAQLIKIGFKDAFVKNINTVELIKITKFETGGAKADPIVAVVETSKGDVAKAKPQSKKEVKKVSALPESYDVLFKKSSNKSKGETAIPVDVPESYGDGSSGNTTRIQAPEIKEKVVALPKIRVKVKRTSAIELQKILKAEGVYKNSLDGYYGKGTTAGYTAIKKQNQQIKKYLLLSNAMDLDASAALKTTRLQTIIDNVLQNPADANTLLKAESSPIAKVYRAYILFQNEGGQQVEVNRLMNAAIQQTFKGKKLKNTPPFDYNSTYAYQDLEQLLKHLNYINAAAGDAQVPCWIFSQHPIEAANAFAAGGSNLRMADCGGDFMSWEEIKLLKTIAVDLDPALGTNQKELERFASDRTRLFMAPKKMSVLEEQETMAWHKSLWTAMENWGNSDPIHEQRVIALKVAYFQSQVRIEDYFMNKGFTYKQAKPLAMSVLRTIAAPHFVNYMKG